MQTTKQPAKDIFTEEEVAYQLGISISSLHQLLDEHIFNDGTPRPARVEFTASDILLLGFWRELRPNPKVVRMPNRR